MLLTVFRFLTWLPLPLLHAVGRMAGRIAYAKPGKYRQRIQEHARQAGYTDPAFAGRAAAEAGAMIMELPKVWLRNEQSLAITVSDDNAVVEQALHASGFEQIRTRGLWELRQTYASFDLLAQDLAARKGRSILHELDDAQLREAIALIAEKLSHHHGMITEKDRWTLWWSPKP